MYDPGRASGDVTFKTLSPVEEAALALRLKKGDRRVMETLLTHYWEGLLRFALGIIGDRDRAEDIVQDAFIQLWERRPAWRHSESLRPILYRIVRNRALNENRRQATFLKWAVRFRRSELDPAPSALQKLEESGLRDVVRRAVDSLPDRRKEIFILVRFHHLSYKEAGQALEVSPQTIANQMTQATRDLREILGSHLSEEAGHPIPFSRADAG